MSTTPNLGLTLLTAGQLQPEVTVNGDLLLLDGSLSSAAAFSNNPATTTGLTYGYFGGYVWAGATEIAVAAGTVTLTASLTNYVQMTAAGVISVNTTGFTSGQIPLATVVTGTTSITSIASNRPLIVGDSASGNVLFKSSATLAVALSATSASLLPTGVGSLTTAANSLSVGSMLRLSLAGYSTSNPGTVSSVFPTITFGAATVGSAAAGKGSIGTTASGFSFYAEALITCLSTGATGSFVASFHGKCGHNTNLVSTEPTEWGDSSVGATFTLNTTIANALNVLLAASVACNLLVTNVVLEQL